MTQHASDDAIRSEMRRLANASRVKGDLIDLRSRIARRTKRKRIIEGASSGAIALVVLVSLLVVLRPLSPTPRDQTGVAAAGLPTGTLVLRVGDATAVLDRGSDQLDILSRDVAAYDVSTDGSAVVGTKGEQLATGLFRQSELVLLSIPSGTQRVLSTAGTREGFAGPIEFSPDGTQIAYTRVIWDVDPNLTHPSEAGMSLSTCVTSVSSSESSCLPAGQVAAESAWLPNGDRLLVDTDSGLAIADVATGQLDQIVSDEELRVSPVAKDVGIDSPVETSVDNAHWSPSGSFLGALLDIRTTDGFAGYVPIVLDAGGRLVAHGIRNFDAAQLAWSPNDDQLAYSTGVVGVPPPGSPSHGVRLLDVHTAQDEVLISTEAIENRPGVSDPFVLSLEWSADGRWIAASGRDQLRIVDVDGREPVRFLNALQGRDVAELVGWINTGSDEA